jgi:4-aminobutyrate aminotransferase-like enzyme
MSNSASESAARNHACERAGRWNALIVMPPLTLDETTMNEALGILEAALKRIVRGLD